jgi:UPF0755 protein
MQTNFKQSFIISVVLVFIIASGIVALLTLPSPTFSPSTLTISSGATVSEAADTLADNDVILHPFLVSVPLRLNDSAITAGRYNFPRPISPLQISNRLAAGDFQIAQKQVVIPEGFTREDIANRILSEMNLPFSKADFMQSSKGLEGYLFPDSYQFQSDATVRQVVETMRDNFRTQINKLQPELREFPYSEDQIIKMASLVEKEAADYEMRRKVAGILWKRFDEGMPLQADAVFAYLLDKSSAELTKEDLAMESPYNLYKNTGLPPTPIANPGLDAIRATINPIRTDNLYYLTGDDGEFYFAETLEEHNENKRTYLQD